MSSPTCKPADPAPWRSLFLSHISLLPMPTFTLCTLCQAPASSKADNTPPFFPRARTCVFRSMFGEVYAPKASSYASELLAFTTDVRMNKVRHLFQTSGSSDGDCQGSGGGGPCEAVFWIEETKTQWRVRGDAWILSARDVEGDGEGARRVRGVLGERLRRVKSTEEEDVDGITAQWNWTKEIDALWEMLPDGVKRSFGNTQPGLFRKSEDQEERTAIVTDNFRVCVIRPFEIEQLDLRVSGAGRCFLYTYVEDTSASKENDLAGGWKTEEMWP